MSRFRVYAIASVLALGAVAACGPATVKVTYSQVANFYQMDDHDPSQVGPVTSFTAEDGVFVLYRILKIENTSNKSFTFDSSKVVMITNDHTGTDDMPNQYPFAGHLGTVAVGANQTVDNPGCIVKWAKVNDPKTLLKDTALIDPIYQLDADPKATMSRKAGDSKTQVLANGVAFPDSLAKLCAGP